LNSAVEEVIELVERGEEARERLRRRLSDRLRTKKARRCRAPDADHGEGQQHEKRSP
jgi:hypothetical protein